MMRHMVRLGFWLLFGMIDVAGVISAVDVKPGAWIHVAKGAQSLLLFLRQCGELAFIVTAVNWAAPGSVDTRLS